MSQIIGNVNSDALLKLVYVAHISKVNDEDFWGRIESGIVK